MNFYTEEKRILQEAMNKGKLIVFVGAGVSASSGMPLWKEALKGFAIGLGLKSEEVYDNLKIPQMYYNARGKKEYVDLARNVFKYGKSLPTNMIHDCIMELNVNQIITTNYDHLLEDAALRHNRIYQVISKDEDIPYASGNRRIIKMHGDFENGNFVLKEDDYLNYSTDFGMIETYCKSAIASNVILFLGYSFSDPDVKQIFNWIKVTLKNNFQRAYLIDAQGEYAEHDVQYFKNRGINVLYASREVTDFKKKDISVRTVEMIRALFFDKKERFDLITRLYYQLKELETLAYIPRKYVISALRECDLFVDGGYIRLYCDEKRKYFSEFRKIGKDSNDPKIRLIQRAFNDCGIIGVFDEQEVERATVGFGYRRDCRQNQVEKYLWEFDYVALSSYLKTLECLELEDNVKQKQELLYGYYVQGEYEKALGLSKQISMTYYRKGNFFGYFISEYNRRILALLLSGSFGTKNVDGLLENECSQKRLQEILAEISYSQARNYKLLSDLLQNTLFGNYYEKIIDLREKAKEQAGKYYVFFTGESAVEKIRTLLRDCYNCRIRNLFLGDCFIENLRIFRFGTKALLESMGVGKVVHQDLHWMGDSSENVVVDELVSEDIFYLIKYMSKDELHKTLRDCKIKEIKVSKEVEAYIQMILSNLYEYMTTVEARKRWIEEKLNLIGLLLGKMQVSTTLKVAYLNAVLKAMQLELLEQDTKIISDCIIQFVEENAAKELEEPLRQLLYLLLNKAIKSVYYIQHTGNTLFMNIIRILHMEYQFVLESDWIKRFQHDKLDTILPELSSICPDCEMEAMTQYILNKWERLGEFEIELYARVLMENLMKPVAAFETMAYGELEEARKNPGNMVPNHFISAMHNMVTLYLNDKLIDSKRLQKMMLKSDRKQWVFLADMYGFDYNEFQVEWLSEFSIALCRDIANNPTAKTEIQKVFAKAWKEKRNRIMEQVLNKYFCMFGELSKM